jgi:23S rRNA (adenine2503-C2)-methyltransferase
MELLSQTGDSDLARVFVARFRGDDRLLAEFVDARDPEVLPDEKWVIIISTQFGCPVACPLCDAGGAYYGDLTAGEILAQIDHAVALSPPARLCRAQKFKIQFARMGEPALNDEVLEALRLLPARYDAPGLIPCVATIAPRGRDAWFEELLDIRHAVYGGKHFQLQLSINSTDERERDRLMPYPKMDFATLNAYAERFARGGPRKVALNFALARGVPVDPAVIARAFNPEATCVKLTPLNPTARSREAGLATALDPVRPEEADALCAALTAYGFEVILSIGDVRENAIGSNCGMAVRRMQRMRPESLFRYGASPQTPARRLLIRRRGIGGFEGDAE